MVMLASSLPPRIFWLQGFPDSFRFSGGIGDKHRQLGNAVPPPLAAALGHQLRVALMGSGKTPRSLS